MSLWPSTLLIVESNGFYYAKFTENLYILIRITKLGIITKAALNAQIVLLLNQKSWDQLINFYCMHRLFKL